ncbi:MAG: TonB-dependent receptor [Crocinitomicaceae bacterium]|nr:TonB-dependent receptor [Crocinitomicaceae bacterium]
MKTKILLSFFAFLCLQAYGQSSKVEGTVKDEVTGETIIGAHVMIGSDYKAVTDFDGKFALTIPYGTYPIKITSAGYAEYSDSVEIKSGFTPLNISLGTIEIQEVEVVADLGKKHETPVSITKIDQKTISEELGNRDLPMVLNATPGIYATNQGGGDGDARITIRGFSQRNIAVMIDGVPVNDMENGWVYWSNWFGLDAITQSMEVQRGLGASKIVTPSVGGTMNIVTSGMENRFGVRIKYEVGSGNAHRATIGYNSGKLKGDWGITLAGSFKYRDGWVDKTGSLGGFYYAKIQKKFGNHILSLSAFGAPQKHGQRSYKAPIAAWNHDKALKYDADTTGIVERGYRYNEHWGTLTRRGKDELINEQLNYYHKPQFTLRHFGKLKDGLYLSNVVYASIGKGGGTKLYDYGGAYRNTAGQIDFDRIYDGNQFTEIAGSIYPNIDLNYDSTKLKANNPLMSAVNNHWWVGYLGNIKYEINDKWTMTAGIDYRYYEGEHYHEIYDLLGGDYFINSSNLNDPNAMKTVGDKVAWKDYQRHRNAIVQWAGGYGLFEYSGTRWNIFINASLAGNGYKGVDYFNKKFIDVGDTTIRIGAIDTVVYNGVEYNASTSGLKYDQTKWKWLPSYTFKAGFNYKITEVMGFYVNAGYLSRAPQFSNVVDSDSREVGFYEGEIKNEEILAGEIGYNLYFKKFVLSINGYATYWNNKPYPFGVSVQVAPGEYEKYNVFGMSALHVGGEMDISYKPLKQLTIDAMVSYGDWRWASPATLKNATTETRFDPTGVHVGDAAQSVYALSVRSDFVKGAYIKVRYTWFDRHWADFNPFDLQGADARKDPWKLPGYGIMDITLGYRYNFKKVGLFITGNIFNVLNTYYIQDATNNGYASGYTDFDAKSADVFFGQGITWSVSLGLNIF